jgi:hypothetical protein
MGGEEKGRMELCVMWRTWPRRELLGAFKNSLRQARSSTYTELASRQRNSPLQLQSRPGDVDSETEEEDDFEGPTKATDTVLGQPV